MPDAPAAIGIDLGTTNSLAAFVRDGQTVVVRDASGRSLVPSCLNIQPDGTILVGDDAKDKALSDPANTIFSIKRLMGRSLVDLGDAKSSMPQELVEDLAIDHTNKAVANRHIDRNAFRRNHARRRDLGTEQAIRNFEVSDQTRRNGPAARLDAARPVEQHDRMTAQRQIVGDGRTRRPAADNNYVKCLGLAHCWILTL